MCMCVCCIPCREVVQLATAILPTSLQAIQPIHIHKICCRITDNYNTVINILIYNLTRSNIRSLRMI